MQYSVEGSGNNRVLMVVANAMHRFRFYQVIDNIQKEVHFKLAGSKALAVVSSTVMVYRKPNTNDFHRELMAHNARAMWCGIQSDPDRLVDNMLEYVEAI